jgi:hypothetical protein
MRFIAGIRAAQIPKERIPVVVAQKPVEGPWEWPTEAGQE